MPSAQRNLRSVWLTDLLLLLVALVWGTSYGVAKSALVFYPVLGFLAIRFCLTFAVLLPALRHIQQPEGRAAFKAGLPLGCMLLAIFLCETYGVAHTQAANAAFLISLCVVLTPFVEWALLRRRPDAQTFALVSVSLFGAYLLAAGVELRFNLGDGLMLGAALLRAVGVVMTKRLTQGKQLSTLALTAVQSGVVGMGSLLIALLMLPNGLPTLPHAMAFWGGMGYLVLFCTLFAFFVQNYALRRSSPTRVALLMGSEPVFGALFAALWLGEKLTPLSWIGGGLIVIAALWATAPLSFARPAAAASQS